jgi:hypothetical protein
MQALFDLMATQHGVATAAQARRADVSWHVQDRLVAAGVLQRPAIGVLVSRATPRTWEQRVLEAVWAPGCAVVSHGAAARLHGLDGFDRYDRVDVLCRKGWWPSAPDGTVRHFTRGLTEPADVVQIGAVPVLDIGATLALLPPSVGVTRTAKALDSALRHGVPIEDLREVARRWQRRGRSGPSTMLRLLDERDGRTLPRSWFQRLAKTLFERHRIRLVDEYPVFDERGVRLAELDLADPRRKIGVECQSWRWHATPEAQHHDARRKGALRRLGWEVVDVWWRDLDRPGPIVAELDHLLTTRPVCAG